MKQLNLLKSFMLLCLLMVGMGAWAEKITDYTNIVSGKKYYIGATTSSTDYYLSVNGSSTSTSIAGTAVTDKANATAFVFEGSGTSWTIKFDGTSNYLGLKSSKDNGKVQVVSSAATFTLSNQSGKIRLTIGSYSVQKNNSGTQFGSYGNTQTDVWLEEVSSDGSTPEPTKYTVTVANDIANGTVTASPTSAKEGDEVTLTATPSTGYEFGEWNVTDASSNSITVTDNKFTMPAANVNVSATFNEVQAFEGTITKMSADEDADIKFREGSSSKNDAFWAYSTPLTANNITLSGSNNSSSSYSYFDGSVVRFYQNNSFTLTPLNGATIVKVEIVRQSTTGSNSGTINCSGLTASNDNTTTNTNVYTGSATSAVTFTAAAQARFTKILVYTTGGKVLQSVVVSGTPTKTIYAVGDNFDPTGLTVTGFYDNDDSEEITKDITWSNPEPLAAGQTSVDITATVNGITSDIYTVTGLTVKYISSISVSGTPATLWKGDEFNHDGMTVTANWSDNSQEDVTSSATFSGYDMSIAGLQTVTVTYGGQTASYEINVMTIANTVETAYTVAEAIALIAAGKDLGTEVYVTGVVSQVDKFNETYKSITYWLDDNSFEVYGGLAKEGEEFDSIDDIVVGAQVVVKGLITEYKNKNGEHVAYEMNQNNHLVSYVAPVVTKYNVTISSDIEHGAVTANPATAAAGETVTLTVTPEDGYTCVQLMVSTVNTGDEVDVEDNTFVMPAADVEVYAYFVEASNDTYTLSELAEATLAPYSVVSVSFNNEIVDIQMDEDYGGCIALKDGDNTFVLQADYSCNSEWVVGGTLAGTWNNVYYAGTQGEAFVLMNTSETPWTGLQYTAPATPVEPGEVTAGTYDIAINNALWGTEENGAYNGTIPESLTGTQNGVTITFNKGEGSNLYINDVETRIYANETLTVSVPNGYSITSVVNTSSSSKSATITTSPEGYNAETKTWTGNAQSVTFSVNAANGFQTLTVTFVESGVTPEPTPINGTLNFVAKNEDGYWATFSSDKDVIFDANDVIVYTVAVDGKSLVMIEANDNSLSCVTDKTKDEGWVAGYYVQAGAGVLINSLEESVNYYYIDTDPYTSNDLNEIETDSEYNMLRPASVAKEATGYKFYKLAYSDSSMKPESLGFYWGAANGGVFESRAGGAYLAVPSNVALAAGFSFVDDDNTTTGINEIGNNVDAKAIYNLNGQRVNASAKGIVIMNGKKMLNK